MDDLALERKYVRGQTEDQYECERERRRVRGRERERKKTPKRGVCDRCVRVGVETTRGGMDTVRKAKKENDKRQSGQRLTNRSKKRQNHGDIGRRVLRGERVRRLARR